MFDDMNSWKQQIGRAMHHIERDASKPIQHLHPHYTNEYFKEARTVYLAEGFKTKEDRFGGESVKGAEYNYSDRIRQWHTSEQYDAAIEAEKASGFDRRSAAAIEVYLRTIFGKPNLRLVHILAGFNWSNGYPYQVYGYIAESEGDNG